MAEKNIPQLRFPEFSGEWEEKKLGEIAKIYDGTHQTPNYVKNGIPFVSVENIKDIYSTNKFITIKEYNKNYKNKVEKGDILMTRIGNIGTPTLITRNLDIAYYVTLALLKINKNVYSNFINYNIQSKYFKYELWKRTLHTAYPIKINKNEIGNCILKYGNIAEQQKIAEFLSKVDKQIELYENKIEALKSAKKGYMQKIFNRELRFKDSNNAPYPNWEEKKLGNLCNLKKGKQVNKDNLLEYGKYYYLNGGILPSGYLDIANTQPNSISISEGGNSCGYVKFNKTAFFSGGHNYTLQLFENINNIFLYFCLKNNEKYIMSFRIGSGLPNIQKKYLNNLIINLPILEEQQKIANFLSCFDEQIELNNQKLEHLKNVKKGLLQQMFV